MALVDAVINAAVDGAAATITHVSLHTADPGTTGANEATGGGYTREALVWGAAAGTEADATQVTFDVPSGTFTHFGLWDAATTGNFKGGGSLSQPETFAAAGQMKVTVTLNGDPA